MGIALLALSDLFTPIQSLAHRWIAPRLRGSGRPGEAVELPPDLRYVHVRPSATSSRAPDARAAARPSRPLRVVRVTEADRPDAVGRVVLSGRMEDVCAELERLTALEAAHTQSKVGTRHLH